MDTIPIKAYVVRDDVLYLISGGAEDAAYLLARSTPLCVSALLRENATADLHASARHMLHRVHETESGQVPHPPLAIECQECTRLFPHIAAAKSHIDNDDTGCGEAQGFFRIVEVH